MLQEADQLEGAFFAQCSDLGMQPGEIDTVLTADSVVVLARFAPNLQLKLGPDRMQDLPRVALVPAVVGEPVCSAVLLSPVVWRAWAPTQVPERLDGRAKRPGHAVPRGRSTEGVASTPSQDDAASRVAASKWQSTPG